MPLIQIEINGRPHMAGATQSVEDLISALELAHKSLAVSVNRQVVRRGDWPTRRLQASDRIEIVHAIGGG